MLGLTMAYSDVSELLVTISDYCIKFVFTKGDPLPTQWSIYVCVCIQLFPIQPLFFYV